MSTEQQHNVNLKGLNTFGMDVQAQSLIEVTSIADVKQLVSKGTFQGKFLILGGGSNVLFTDDYNGVIVLNRILGKTVIEESETSVVLQVSAGENWHETVQYCVDQNWCGIENLSLIPGCVGAAPIQNIGAYGVEIKDVLESVHFIDLETGQEKQLTNDACGFGYRNSVFKHDLKNKVLITSIVIRLAKQPSLKLEYGAIKDELANNNYEHIGIKEVSKAVIAIRQSKLPNPADLGNAGSFFKNPVVPKMEYDRISNQFPDVRGYVVDDQHMKLAAGWLIEQCGWKGKRVGDTGSHAKQALVLVNYGQAKGADVRQLAHDIIESVWNKFGVRLEPEVNII
ncbi:MAG: UDP-N-acetylmuramate dehydrogenase [Bacteroidia bacterium]|nr:UDP-N-acetylmuramate dehydrogenase [Bacteroidia bacterium]